MLGNGITTSVECTSIRNNRRGVERTGARDPHCDPCCRCPACRVRRAAEGSHRTGHPGAQRRDHRVRASARTRLHRAARSTTPAATAAREHGLLLNLRVADRDRGRDLLAERGLSSRPARGARVLGGRVPPRTACAWTTTTSTLGGLRRRRLPLPGQQRQAGQRHRAAARDARPRHPVGMGTTRRRATTTWTCSPTYRLAASLAPGSRPLGDRARRGRGVLARHERRGRRHRPTGPRAAGRTARRTSCTSTPGTWCSAGRRSRRRPGAPGVVQHGPARARRTGSEGRRWSPTAPRPRSTSTRCRASRRAAARLALG